MASKPQPLTEAAPARPGRVRRAVAWLPTLAVAALALWAVAFLALSSRLPDESELLAAANGASVTLLAADGEVLAERGQSGAPFVPLERVDDDLINAVLAIEDRRFFDHFGVDPLGVGRALWLNLTSGRVVAGGSTLTQQLAKNLYLTPERSLTRKLDELALSLWLEVKLGKERILELYLNRVYLGAGAYGVEAASRTYYGKPASDLTPAEAALLAGLLKAPSRLAPTSDFEAAWARARLVLNAMAEAGVLTREEAEAAAGDPPELARGASAKAGHFVSFALDELGERAGRPRYDAVVRTTLDTDLQAAAEAAVAAALADRPGLQAAVVAITTAGEVVAMVGGRDPSDPTNRAVSAHRQPGSAFKPFVFAAAIEDGLEPTALIDARPVEVDGWTAGNAGGRSFEELRAEDALARSVNTAAVRLALQVGPGEVAETAGRLGVESPLRAVPSLALGTSEVTPLELTRAYLPFAAEGVAAEPHAIRRVASAGGTVLWRFEGGEERVMDAADARDVASMLRAVVEDGTGRRAALADREVAGKTGTTQDARDAWFVGFAGDLVVGVWVGRDDAGPMQGVNGSNLPAEIWRRTVQAWPAPAPAVAVRRGGEEEPAVAQGGDYLAHRVARWWRRNFGDEG